MKIRVIKKMMAYLLVGAMVLSTPMTASATEPSIADVYTDTDDGDNNSGTSTISGSMTGSYKFEEILGDPEREAQVIGLALDKTSLSLEVDGGVSMDRLQARVLYSDYDPSKEEMVLRADEQTKEIIDKYLSWEVLGNENGTVAISADYKKPDGSRDLSMVNVKAKKGGEVTVRAFIDYDGDGEFDKEKEYYADAVVTVKERATAIEFTNLPENFYLKHTYNLNDYIQITPATAKCEIGFSIASIDGTKIKDVSVDINEKGLMTVKKVKKNTKVLLKAVTEDGIQAKPVEVTFDPGVPAKKVNVSGKNVLDFGERVKKDKDDLNGTATILTADLEAKNTADKAKITDIVDWSVKQGKTPIVNLVKVVDENGKVNDRKIKVQLIENSGVGTATITAKATSGAKKTYKITVNSTPTEVVVKDIETWTGKKPTLKADLYADDYKESNGIIISGTRIPVGKTKVSFKAATGEGTDLDPVAVNLKNVKVNAKGVITSSNLLTQKDNKKPIEGGPAIDKRTINVTAKFKVGKSTSEKKDSCIVTVKQADIRNIAVMDVTHGGTGTPITFDSGKKKEDGKDVFYAVKTARNAVVGGTYKYQALAFDDLDCSKDKAKPNLNDAIAWASSSAKVGTISDNGQLSVIKGGTTKLTASYVTITTNKSGKKIAKLNKKTIPVKAVQKATSLTLNKNIFTVVAGTNAKDISISVKKQLPSGAKDKITWKQIVGELDKDGNTIVNAKYTNLSMNPANSKTTTVKVPVKDYTAGTVVKIGAYADGGAVAYAYIYVVDKKTTAVEIQDKDKKKVTNVGKSGIKVGEKFVITPNIVTGSGRNKVATPADKYTKNNVGYTTDPVTYSFNKAGIASIDKDGNIIALKPGTTKLTVQALSGKKATMTIKVVE